MTPPKDKPNYTRHFWAKAQPYGKLGPERIHLLEHHLADVGACFKSLMEIPTIRKRLATTGGLPDLHESLVDRLSLLAAFHDIGKVNVGFQARVWRNEDLPSGRRPQSFWNMGHTVDLTPVLDEHGDTETACWFFDALDWWWEATTSWDNTGGKTVCALFVASLSHHGSPLNLNAGKSPNPPAWRCYGSLNPQEYVKKLGKLSRSWFPEAFTSDVPSLPSAPAFQHMFLGLCNWADWIGSDECRFPFVDQPRDDYILTARKRAREAIEAIGLNLSDQRRSLHGVPEFSTLFELDGSPNAIQNAVLNIPLDKQLVIIESETGSGKTEAALLRFAKLYEAGKVDGIYFALPTRSAAVQMHQRVRRFTAKLFPHAPPPSILAVSGYQSGADSEPVAMYEYDERAAGVHPDPIPWASERSKRYLAAQIAVGTVDQAMMGALQVKNAHMRAACLSRNLLVVDEVHASDTYMRRIIKALLDAHLGVGGYALLMSATLGSATRQEWLSSGRLNPDDVIPLDKAIKSPYPAVSTVGAGLSPAGENDRKKRVSITAKPVMHDFSSTASLALSAARNGAKVLVVRNTVDYAIKTQLVLEELASGHDRDFLFTVKVTPTLHHGRFAACDRKMLDGRVEELLGKPRESGGHVVIGTQTLEQSLDIDADLLITDLCPVDVLLQRIGRLHRHNENARPACHENPTCIVLMPDDGDLSPLLKRGSNRNGLGPHGYVYEDLRILEATRRLIGKHKVWDIPKMNRELVERATHPEALLEIVGEMGDEWRIHANDLEGGKIAEGLTAATAIIKRDKDFLVDNHAVQFGADEVRIRTRLGDDRVDVTFDPQPASPLDKSLTIEKLPISVRWLDSGEVADSVGPRQREEGGFTFSVGSRSFLYDRLGLRRDE